MMVLSFFSTRHSSKKLLNIQTMYLVIVLIKLYRKYSRTVSFNAYVYLCRICKYILNYNYCSVKNINIFYYFNETSNCTFQFFISNPIIGSPIFVCHHARKKHSCLFSNHGCCKRNCSTF